MSTDRRDEASARKSWRQAPRRSGDRPRKGRKVWSSRPELRARLQPPPRPAPEPTPTPPPPSPPATPPGPSPLLMPGGRPVPPDRLKRLAEGEALRAAGLALPLCWLPEPQEKRPDIPLPPPYRRPDGKLWFED